MLSTTLLGEDQCMGVIRLVSSFQSVLQEEEERRFPKIEFDWDDDITARWPDVRRDTLAHDLFQTPWTSAPQCWEDLHYQQASRAHDQLIDLRYVRYEKERKLLEDHLCMV